MIHNPPNAAESAAIRECAKIIEDRMRWLKGELVLVLAKTFYQLDQLEDGEWEN